MVGNPIQFAIVREDPEIEASLIARQGARRALLIASGGCTALSLQALQPELEITLLDFNPAQLALVEKKARALRSALGEERKKTFNIDSGDPSGLNACGNFESLFRQLRFFLNDFVASPSLLQEAFERGETRALLERFQANRYWPVAFDLFFADSLLNAMFGPAATQHAPRGSYPGYFRAAFEKELARERAARNPFLHHILLGHYLDRDECLPPYLRLPVPAKYRFKPIEGDLQRLPDLGEFDFIALSNIFDWSARPEIEYAATRLRAETRPGTVIVYRQLNHSSDFQELFAPEFKFKREDEAKLLDSDRSFFYSKLNIGVRSA